MFWSPRRPLSRFPYGKRSPWASGAPLAALVVVFGYSCRCFCLYWVGVVAPSPRPCFVGLSLSCAAARIVSFAAPYHCALMGAHRLARCVGGGTPPTPSWLAGAPVPCFASAARYARTARRRGRLRRIGSRLRLPFLSADAIGLQWRAVAMLRVRFGYLSLASSCALSLSAFGMLCPCVALWRYCVAKHPDSL